MNKKAQDFASLVDVFFGSGEVSSFPESGIASKWFYIKALCGNTSPAAVLPMGKISVGAYSGAYPTGYGTHLPNFSGSVEKIPGKMKIRGFSHIHQSGTGAIGYYYNYAIASPFYGKIKGSEEFFEIENESASPGEYSVDFNDISSFLTVTASVAFHKYIFKKSGGRVAVDFSNDGLLKEFGKCYYSHPNDIHISLSSADTVLCSGVFSGIRLYFCVKAYGKNIRSKLYSGARELSRSSVSFKSVSKSAGAVFDFDSDEIILKVTFSTLSFENAEKNIDLADFTFEEAKENARKVWNRYLSSVEIETDDEVLKNKFYSCLYHSLVKPSIMTGENILAVCGDTVSDLATFWDQYKTLLPLIYMLYGNEGKKICDAVINISRTLGKIPCSFALTDKFPCEQQAKMLGIISLCDAYHFSLCDIGDIEECVKRELEREEIKKFLKTGYFERYTHILDTVDACLDVSEITNDEPLRQRLLKAGEYMKNAYTVSGILSEKSKYYEGDRFTYSFRLHNDMEKRMTFSGSRENFINQLDEFFGFGKDSVKQLLKPDEIKKADYHRFEGFNNECDMETPFSYVFAGEYEKLCLITKAAVYSSFKTGRGGLPGNNDSGGLSSCFIWLVLGMFPWAGKGKFLLSSPHIKKARLLLSSGKTLIIEAAGDYSKENTAKEVLFNNRKIENRIISAKEISGGGTLKFIF